MYRIPCLTSGELANLSSYLLANRHKAFQIIPDFGEVCAMPTPTTYSLTSHNKLFTICDFEISNGKIDSVWLGGPHLGLGLADLLSVYEIYASGYVPYDDAYHYLLRMQTNSPYSIEIILDDKIATIDKQQSVEINLLQIKLDDGNSENPD